jgi:hypothetical protein
MLHRHCKGAEREGTTSGRREEKEMRAHDGRIRFAAAMTTSSTGARGDGAKELQ